MSHLSNAARRVSSTARHLAHVASTTAEYKLHQVGAANTLGMYLHLGSEQRRFLQTNARLQRCTDYRVYLANSHGKLLSPFHDIPLFVDDSKSVLNMVVEIPRWSNAKQEISKEEALNPIKQDTKKGNLRYVRNCFPHKGYIWNYGAFPQTFEDPDAVHPDTHAKGDNDPLDVLEIGEVVGYTGQVKQVKVVGVMALLDEGETDWKVLVIDVNDPLAPKLNDIADVETHLPGLIQATHEWFRIYKIPDGKPANQFAFEGQAKDRQYATDVVHECHEAWQRLVNGQQGDTSIANATLEGTPGYQADFEVPAANPQPPAPIDPSINKWFFVS